MPISLLYIHSLQPGKLKKIITASSHASRQVLGGELGGPKVCKHITAATRMLPALPAMIVVEKLRWLS